MPNTFHISFFKNIQATTIKTADLTLEELRIRILDASAPTKSELPWLKMAIFGKRKTDKGSLRHDANIQNITGIEFDYDDEKVPFDEALEYVRKMGIKAIVYTSPSHRDAHPRWRILAPTSIPREPAVRSRLVTRINGYMGKLVNKPESFTLSQAFYYGRAHDNAAPNHQCVICDGVYVDLATELEKFEAVGRYDDGKQQRAASGKNPFEELGEGAHNKSESGFEYLLTLVGDHEGGKGFNDPLSRAVASYVSLHNGNPYDRDVLKNLLRDAINAAEKRITRKHSEIDRYLSDKYLDNIIDTSERKYVERKAMSIDDFISYLPMHQYMFMPTRELWPASSLNSTLAPVPRLDVKGRPILNKKTGTQRVQPAASWLDKNRAVQQMTWAPGESVIIRDRLVDHGGWIDRKGARMFNLYREPNIKRGKASNAIVWRQHIERIYPDDAEHIIKWLAHRVQKPFDKINHCLLLGGGFGIGKDTMLEPVKRAIGPWNFQEVSPTALMGRFNGFLRAVILRVSEVRDLGDVNRFTFYEHMKTITAAPPDVLRIDEKHLREHYIFNCCGVIETTNHKTDGIYLPPGDRRTYVAWSNCVKEDFTDQYWKELWDWIDGGGDCDVAAYLLTFDLSTFNPKAPPPKTEAFHAIVSSGYSSEESELADIIDALGNPPALTLSMLEDVADPDFSDWLTDRKNRRAIPHKLESAGYVSIRNEYAKDGIFVVKGRRQMIYSRCDIPPNLQKDHARNLIKEIEGGKTFEKNNQGKSTIHPFPGPRKNS
jgi:hypothetical protein